MCVLLCACCYMCVLLCACSSTAALKTRTSSVTASTIVPGGVGAVDREVMCVFSYSMIVPPQS